VAWQIFNLSVDMPDGQPSSVPEDLSVNEMESVIEIVLEKCFGIEDAISEQDEPGEESEMFDIVKVLVLYCANVPEFGFFIQDKVIPNPLMSEELYCQYHKDINPPPPKA
jgi:hypothetical protein